MSIAVVTDSGADIDFGSPRFAPVGMVPLTVRLDGKEYVDKVELSTEEFWARCRDNKVRPSTAAPSIGSFQLEFERAAAEHTGVICVTLASGFSATYQAAMAAAKSMEGKIAVSVVDSRSVSMGQGLLVRLAQRLCERDGNTPKELSLEAVTAQLEQAITKIRLFGVLDTLEYLRHGGRIGTLKLLLGQALSFKPVIEIADGKINLLSRQRTRSRSIDFLLQTVSDLGAIDELSLVHAVAQDAQTAADDIKIRFPSLDFDIRLLGAVIGSHVGPGAMGIAISTGI